MADYKFSECGVQERTCVAGGISGMGSPGVLLSGAVQYDNSNISGSNVQSRTNEPLSASERLYHTVVAASSIGSAVGLGVVAILRGVLG